MFIHSTLWSVGVVDGVGGPHTIGCTDRSLEQGCAAVDCKFGLAVEDYEHLLAVVVKVLTDARMGMEHAAMQKEQIGGKSLINH
jgi:hypothetical protein